MILPTTFSSTSCRTASSLCNVIAWISKAEQD